MSELPEGWTSATLAEVTRDIPNANPEHQLDEEFGYVDISSINNSNFSITAVKKIKGVNAPSRAKRPIHAGDVLFSNVRTYLRNIAIVPDDSDAQICSTGFTVLHSNGAVDPRYLFRWVLTDSFIERVTPQQTGTHYPATSDRVVKSEEIPLPPLNEQRRIVAKLEELLSRVDAAQARLATIPRILKRFRQSVLVAACSGQLTANWRLDNATAFAGQDSATPTSAMMSENLPYEIPETWFTTSLDLLCAKITDGEHLTPPLSENGVPLLSAKDVREDFLDFTETKFVTQDVARKSRSRCNPERGDILVVSRGATVGRTCMVEIDDEFCLMGSVLLFKPNPNVIQPNMLEYCFKSPHGLSALIARSGATAQQAIYIRDMRDFPVPLPPLAEQQEIVRRVEALFQTADALEARYSTAKAHVDKLTQSILAKAFRGELVPQDPNDEPASVLLERIRSARVSVKRDTRRRRKEF